MERINEWLSVSDEVTRISRMVAERILSLTQSNKPTQIGMINSIPFNEGNFTIQTESCIGEMTVCYQMYYCTNEYDYNKLSDCGALNCGADHEFNTILIHNAYVNNEPPEDFIETISHEVNHLFQYSNGMAKNEDLYDNVLKVLNRYAINNLSRFTALLVYYTFKHEVDSFATQFYHHLKQMDKGNIGFVESAKEYQYYANLHYMYDTVMRDIDDPLVNSTIKKLGLTKKQWKHRVYSGVRRFDNKLYNVYRRYCIEKLRNTTVEGMVSRQAHLGKRYHILEETIEPIYELAE